MEVIDVSEVREIQARMLRARELTAARFQEAFAADPAPPEERWGKHLELQAGALLETAAEARLPRGATVHYDVEQGSRLVTPYVLDSAGMRHEIFEALPADLTPAGVLELWLIQSELLVSTAWAMTRLIVTAGEFDESLAKMRDPQLVRLPSRNHAPTVDLRGPRDGMLEVTVYSRAGEERIERRRLSWKDDGQFHFHSRDLLAEGRGGVKVE